MNCTGFAFIIVQLTCSDPVPPAVICPPVHAWGKDFQRKVAEEIRSAPQSALATVAIDSIRDRDVARACAKQNKRAEPSPKTMARP